MGVGDEFFSKKARHIEYYIHYSHAKKPINLQVCQNLFISVKAKNHSIQQFIFPFSMMQLISYDLPTPSDLFTHFIPKYLQLADDITAKYLVLVKKPFSSKLTKMCSCSAHSIVLAKKMREGGKTKQATTLIFHMNIV